MTDKKNEGALPKVSKDIKDLPPKPGTDANVKGGMGDTMGGGTGTTGDNTIPM